MPFKRPKKEETLAKKAVKRNYRLFFNNRLMTILPRWWVGTAEILGLTLLFLLNFLLLLPFFGQEDKSNIFSAPLIPVLSKLFFLMSFPVAIRFWLLFFILFLPVTFYFFVREISGRRITAFLASLIISLPLGIFLPLRLKLALFTEDGNHIASLTLGILACLFLLRFLRSGNFKMGVSSSLLISLVALTSPLGLFILGCFSLAISFSEMLLSQGRLKFFRFLTVFMLAAGLVSFWYNPGFVFLIVASPQGELIKGTLASLFPLSFFLVPLLGAFGFLLFENRPRLQPLFLAVFLSIGFGLLSLGAGMQLSSPYRFLPSLGMALAFLGSIVLARIFDFLKRRRSFRQFSGISRYRKQILFFSITLFFTIITSIIMASAKNFGQLEQEEVLGLVDSKTTGIWEARNAIGWFHHIIGGSISFSTAGLLIFIRKQLAKQKNEE
ncbi:MAG TPA: hypothetical protein VMW29_00360 [Candidatus Bathyarchaeia archaeon]|nr:hypothetical protein [Candidatus Bathyarchaeia archaeon]